MSDDEDLCIMLLWRQRTKKKIAKNKNGQRKLRAHRVHPILQERSKLGTAHLVEELRLDRHRYINYLRMPSELFDELLSMVGPQIYKTDAFREDTITPTQRLALTLRYLASGDSMISLYYAYRISRSSVSNIIRETTAIIWNTLKDIVFRESTASNWINTANEFNIRWNFPNCLGAIDGKHVVLQAPKNSGSIFFNYKWTHSVVLLAVADANYCFSMVDIGGRGRESDGGIFKRSAMGQNLYKKQMNIPAPGLVGNNRRLPYVFVGDEAFQLTEFMMRPYPGRGRVELTQTRRIFNYRLSRARRIIENTFGVWSARWRIFRKPINCDVETVINIIKATVCLHNFIRRNDKDFQYISHDFVDSERSDGEILRGQWRSDIESNSAIQDLPRMGSNTYTQNAAHVRDQFAEYFINEGAVEWQWNKASVIPQYSTLFSANRPK